jgi:lysophospholipase L1-like esterase
MRSIYSLLFAVAAIPFAFTHAQELEPKPPGAYFEKFPAKKAPQPQGLALQKGDRLAICGDSITEQKMYSRIMETYLTVAVPELGVTVRQYGWSGEQMPGFVSRMTNDTLRFKPTIATTCYGMNDHGYRPYEQGIGDRYRASSTAAVQAFKNAGARVILGSAGSVGKVPAWSKDGVAAGVDALNQNLCELRNIDIEIAQKEGVGFADVFWPMLTADYAAQAKYGTNYAVPGKDGVHPGWAGQTVMAYAFLKGLGLNGEIGAYTIDLGNNTATVSQGHELVSYKDGAAQIKSARYPFCATGDTTKDDTIRSGMTLVPFNEDLNRLMLVVKNAPAQKYRVTWGTVSKSFSSEELSKGVNLAALYETNPFSDAFKKVDEAVAAKQNYETRQIKELFHGPEGRADKELTAQLTEKVREPLAKAISAAFVPVTHTVTVVAE